MVCTIVICRISLYFRRIELRIELTRAYALNQYISQTSLRAYPYALEVAVMIRHNYLMGPHPENHWYIKVGRLLVLVHADKPKQLPRAAKLYNRYMIQVPDGHHVVLLKDCNEPLDMDLTWRQVRDTLRILHPIPTTASRCISTSTSLRR
jgi:hypothetical protein